jgi:hypothetical protein
MNATIDQRIAATFAVALRASHGVGSVRIHVGQEVWDGLRAYAKEQPGWATPDRINKLFGFPLLLEAAWEPGRIVVRTDEEIE